MSTIKVEPIKLKNTYIVTQSKSKEETGTSRQNEQVLSAELEKEFYEQNKTEFQNFRKIRPVWTDNNDVINDAKDIDNYESDTKHELLAEMITQLADIDWPTDVLRRARGTDSVTNSDNNVDLFDAIRDGKYGVIKRQLAGDKDKVNMADGESLSLLHWSAIEDQIKIAEYLLENGATVDMRDGNGLTPLHYACMCKHVDMVKLLLKWSADVMAVSNDQILPKDLTEDEHIKYLLNKQIRDMQRKSL